MAERPYTIAEIDALRSAVRDHFMWGSYFPDMSAGGPRYSRTYRQEELDNHVEQRVRTLMMAGLVADDLREKAA